MWIQLNHRLIQIYVSVILLLSHLSLISSKTDEYEELNVNLELIDLDLQDQCDQLSLIAKSTYLKIQTGFKEKIKLERGFGKYARIQANILKKFEDIPDEVERNWTLLTTPGDSLLPEEDWQKAVVFSNSYEEISRDRNISCASLGLLDCSTLNKQDAFDILARSENITLLKDVWWHWSELFSPLKDRFLPVLKLVPKAATLNDRDTPKEYWDMLAEYEYGIDKANELWSEIQPLYMKLHTFVQQRLYNKFDISDNSTEQMPVYMLGSFFANDWSNIADSILPHPHFYREVNRKLRKKSVSDMYQMAEKMLVNLKLPQLGEQFYANSIFNATCNSDVLSFCNEKYSEIITCSKTNWQQYLEAHKYAIKIALRSQEYEYYIRTDNRLSSLDVALEELAAIMAIENLPSNNLLPAHMLSPSEENYNNRMTVLLLIALRTLPSLPYYLLADNWRLTLLKSMDDDDYNSTNPAELWWNMRESVQSISGVSNTEWDFLADSYIAKNKPYIGKFFGTILQFQIMDNLRENSYYSDESNLMKALKEDSNFQNMLQDKPNKDWLSAVNYYYGAYEISSSALLKYFRPLEEYMENASLEQDTEPPTTTEITTTTPMPTTITATAVTRGKISSKRENASANVNSIDSNSTETKSGHVISGKNADEDNVKNVKQHSAAKDKISKTEIGIYVAIGALAIVAVSLVIYIVVKKRRRPVTTTNNRRFEP